MNYIPRLIRLVTYFGGVKLLLRIVPKLKKELGNVNRALRMLRALVEKYSLKIEKKEHLGKKLNLLDFPYKSFDIINKN